MAATAAKATFTTVPSSSSPSQSPKPVLRFTLPFSSNPTQRRSLRITASISNPTQKSTAVPSTEHFTSRFALDEPRKGADILVEALERQGVTDVFAYPGGASMEIHQALTRSTSIRNVLPRHEQGGIFAAEGYARSSGFPGVCIATSGPGATNLVSGLADAMLDSVPLVAITGQVPRRMIGTDAFQETPIVEVTRSITKHNYLVLDIDDIPRIVNEAFFLASSGRPGPVLIDVPKDVQQQVAIPNWEQPIKLPGYMARLPKAPSEAHLEQIVRLILESKKPVLYVGGGSLNSSEELKRFVQLTGVPVASTLMGLGAYPTADENSLQMLGMHGTVYANYAVDKSDLLLAFGVKGEFEKRIHSDRFTQLMYCDLSLILLPIRTSTHKGCDQVLLSVFPHAAGFRGFSCLSCASRSRAHHHWEASYQETSGAVRKAGGNFKEKLREHGGLDAVFEVTMNCHLDLENWMEDNGKCYFPKKRQSDSFAWNERKIES